MGCKVVSTLLICLLEYQYGFGCWIEDPNFIYILFAWCNGITDEIYSCYFGLISLSSPGEFSNCSTVSRHWIPGCTRQWCIAHEPLGQNCCSCCTCLCQKPWHIIGWSLAYQTLINDPFGGKGVVQIYPTTAFCKIHLEVAEGGQTQAAQSHRR